MNMGCMQDVSKGGSMRMCQERNFKPISLTLESAEEAETFWDLMELAAQEGGEGEKEFALFICDWFSNNYQG